MRRPVVAFLLGLGLLTGCAEPTSLPAPTLAPAVADTSALVSGLVERSDEQRSVRFAGETTLSGRTIHLNGGLLRAQEGRLVSLSEDSSVDVVITADAGYSRPSGGRWTRYDLADHVPVKTATTAVGLADEVDPAAVVALLGGGLIVQTGDETVDGVPTHRYTMLVDLRQQADRTIDSDRRARLLAAYASGFTATATVWVGPGELPVRVEQVLRTLEDNVFQSTVHRFTDWNADIRVTAPAL